MKPSPFEIKKAQCDFALGRIEKADHIHHKYIRKEENKYIYENAKVKTPIGHGVVMGVKRHPIDINHINSVKVLVRGKEHDFHPDAVTAEQHLFTDSEKNDFNKMTLLSRELNLPDKKYKIDFNDKNLQHVFFRYQVLAGVNKKPKPLPKNAISLYDGDQPDQRIVDKKDLERQGVVFDSNKEQKIQEIARLTKKLEAPLWKLMDFRRDHDNEVAGHQWKMDQENKPSWGPESPETRHPYFYNLPL